MSDLREALDYFDGREAQTPQEAEILQQVFDAARRLLAGTPIRWCEEHESKGAERANLCETSDRMARRNETPRPCRIVSGRFVADES